MNIEDKAKAVGHIPSGLFIVTAKHSATSDKIDGYLGSWIQQVSFDPLLISLCVKEGRPAYDAIMSGEPFTVNVVGKHDGSYLKHFWSGYNPEVDVFENVAHEESPEGGILLTQALSSIVCRKVSATTPGDHAVVIAEVLTSYVHNDEAKPSVHIRKSGLEY